MQGSKWGNSLAIRKKLKNKDLLANLRAYRGRLPADFKFDRLDAHGER